MATAWRLGTLGGSTWLDLRTLAINIRDAGSWDGFSAKRSGNQEVAYRDGEFSDPRKWFRAKEIPLKMLLLDRDASGLVTNPEGAEGHLRENLDAWMGALYKRNSFLDLQKYVPAPGGGFHWRSAACEVVDFFPIEDENKIVRECITTFRMVEGLWRQYETTGTAAPQKSVSVANVTTTTQAVNVPVGGNAPVRGGLAGAFEIEFEANSAITNPRFETDANGEFVQYSGSLSAGEVLVIDVGQQTATIDGTTRADAGLTSGHAWMIDLDPDGTTACTASVSSASDFDIAVRWYDRWL
jgi:hypothetical protein